jgi:nucleotide-binding universal stress UspA family protein
MADPGLTHVPPNPTGVSAIDEAERDHAANVAEAGARLARGVGATADALPAPDEADVADTHIQIAEQRDACAVVVGSRRLSCFKRHLLGSTSQHLLRQAHHGVLVVRSSE